MYNRGITGLSYRENIKFTIAIIDVLIYILAQGLRFQQSSSIFVKKQIRLVEKYFKIIISPLL